MQPLDTESVRAWRHRRMLSQQEVADRAGTSLFTIQRIERGEGNVRPKTGRAVAAALGVPIEELLPKVQSPLPFDTPTRAISADEHARGMSEWAGLFEKFSARYRDELEALRAADGDRLFYLFLQSVLTYMGALKVAEDEGFLGAGEGDSDAEHRARRKLQDALHELYQTSEILSDVGELPQEQLAMVTRLEDYRMRRAS